MSNLFTVKNIAILLILFGTWNNQAYADNQPNIEFKNIWVVLPPDVARSTAGYGIIKNTGNAPDTLLHISSNAGTVMLHKTDIESGMAHMHHMPNRVMEPNSELILKPMSFHLMFTDLCPIIFTEKNKVTIQFEFDRSGTIEVEVPVLSSWE